MSPVRQVSGGLISPIAIFVTSSGDLCVDNGNANGRVDMWMPGSNDSFTVMYVDSTCFSLFMDIYQNIYCSVGYQHRVIKKSSNDVANISVSVAGNGTNGSASDLLSSPRGIFVDTQLNLYVADCGNHRVQFFVHGQLTATTVLGNGSVSTIVLDCPHAVILDADGHLFVADSSKNRIIGWGPNGYQCIAACQGSAGSASDFLNGPVTLWFDSYGNIFVADAFNNRIQKFLITNHTGEFLTWIVTENACVF